MAVVIPYTKQTWTDGSSSCSAARNNVHEDGINDAHYMPTARVTHSATQATVSATPFVVAFNTESYDKAGNVASTQHDTVTNNSRLICRHAGVYSIKAGVIWAASPVNGTMQFRLNGTTGLQPQTTIVADHRAMFLAIDYDLAVNDYIEVLATQSSGGGLNISTGAVFTWHRVG